jgi:hypothetical protein
VTTTDGQLGLARRQPQDAVAAIVDPAPVWDGGVCRWADPVYLQLRSALAGKSTRRVRAFGSRMPCSIAVLELLCAIDATVPLQAVIGVVWGVETLAPRASYDLLQSVW